MNPVHALFLGGSFVAAITASGLNLNSQFFDNASPVPGCANSVKDSAQPNNCMSASSVPTLGALYPLSSNLFLTPTGDVGIGTTAPTLGVDMHVWRSVGEALLRLTTGAAYGNVAGLQVQAANAGWTIGTGSNDMGGVGALGFRTFPGNTAMVLTSAGNVGIGTTAPANGVDIHLVRNSGEALLRLTTTDSYGNIAGLQVQGYSGRGYTIGTGGAEFGGLGGLGFRTLSGVTRMVLTDAGDLGIGTGTPTATLDVDGETATNTLRIRGGSDVVESFDTAGGTLEPGTVVSLDADHAGDVAASCGAYDKKVVGVVSGAGGVNPGIALSQTGVLDGDVQVAMLGRVYVKCSAENGPIESGDLLTTASLAGHAMRATDPARAFGTVIGKASSALAEGTGLVLVVVNLQ